MMEFAFASYALSLAYVTGALVLVVALLRIFDWMNGIRFSEVHKELIDENNIALGLYYGLRFIGCCILLAAFVAH